MNGLYSGVILLVGVLGMFGLVRWILLRERRNKKFSPFSEPSLRPPGYTLGVQLEEEIDKLTTPLFGISFSPLAYFFILNLVTPQVVIVSIILLVIALVFFVKLLITHAAEVRKLRLGLDGELYTGQELNFLMRRGAYVYHDIPYDYGNIDHVIISTGGIFVVETKAVRKPSTADGKRQYKVNYKNGKLYFPDFTTDSPVKQARRHADHMRKFIKSRTTENVPVTPVIALPGWYVTSSTEDGLSVINPKRGDALIKVIQKNNISESQVEMLAKQIEEYSRSVKSGAEKYDPDANSKYTFWLDRKHEERKL